jgi:hypothetical protein
MHSLLGTSQQCSFDEIHGRDSFIFSITIFLKANQKVDTHGPPLGSELEGVMLAFNIK